MARKITIEPVKRGFEDAPVRIAITDIQPLRLVSDALRKTPKYTPIASSIPEVAIFSVPK